MASITKREADEFRDTVSTEIRHGTYVDRRIAFNVFAEDWLARTKPAVVAIHRSFPRVSSD